jgi:hypothetical protein
VSGSTAEVEKSTGTPEGSIPVPGSERRSEALVAKKSWDSPAANSGTSTGSRMSVTFIASQVQRAPTFSQVLSSRTKQVGKVVVVDLRDELRAERYDLQLYEWLTSNILGPQRKNPQHAHTCIYSAAYGTHSRIF